jgi:hypothetical protein
MPIQPIDRLTCLSVGHADAVPIAALALFTAQGRASGHHQNDQE